MHPVLAAELARVVGSDHVLVDRELVAGFETDWTGRYRGHAPLVVRPGSSDQVAATLRACSAAGVGVVPQGGNTGLVAGATPYGQVVLSTVRLNELEAVDTQAAEVTVGAGATLEAVQALAAGAGLAPAVDLAARGSATIGGMVATDAGGIHAVRHGSMRRQLTGIEAVLADGSVVGSLTGPVRGAAGLDLPSLLAGSEGTLAVITRVRLRLVPVWRHRATALVGFDDVDAAVTAALALREGLADLDALELVDRDGLALVADHGHLAAPFPDAHRAYLVVETAAARSTLDELAGSLSELPGVGDALIADDGPGRRRLWAFREGLTEAIGAAGLPHKLDVGLPIDAIAGFLRAVGRVVAAHAPAARVVVFGHVGVGNLHVNVLGPPPGDERVDDAVLELVLEHGGAISAEHGIGRAKARWLARAGTAGDLAVRAAIKRALDPHGLLNPGVLAPDSGPIGPGRMAVDGPDGNSDIMTRN